MLCYEGCLISNRKNAVTFILIKKDHYLSRYCQVIIYVLWIHIQNLGNIEILKKNNWLLRKRRVSVSGEIFTYFVNNLQLYILIFILFTVVKRY